MPVFELCDEILFPSPRLARRDGLLAVGGDLSPARLLAAYRRGIFPWFSPGDPILWWSPDPRLVLFPAELKVARSLKKVIRKKQFAATLDKAFEKVITACADLRLQNREGTWIGREMIRAYCALHAAGYAHSVEVWQSGRLAGGLYGVALGRCFFGESMFARVDNASKVALVNLVAHLIKNGFRMIDCQVTSAHLMRLGAREIPRTDFLSRLRRSLEKETLRGPWRPAQGGPFEGGR